MKKWLTPEEHSPPGQYHFGWVHPKTGLVFQSHRGWDHASQADELGFRGETDTEANDNAIAAGYTRWYVTGDEIGVHFNRHCPLAPKRAKEILSYHAQNQRGRMLLADTGTDYYHGTSLKDAHDFIDRVSTKMKGRKETDFVKMKRALGEAYEPGHVAWISPTGKIHPVGDTDTHRSWIENNGHHIEPEHIGGVDVTGSKCKSDADWDEHEDRLSEVMSRMIAGGWIRKAYKDSYDVGSQAQFGRVLAHVRQHHPEVERVNVIWPKDPTQSIRGDSLDAFHSARLNTRSFGGSESRADQLIRAALDEAAIDPIYVSCHTCHASVGAPCRFGAKPGEYHIPRKRVAARGGHGWIDTEHGLAHGAACTDDGGICKKCGQTIERLRNIPNLLREEVEHEDEHILKAMHTAKQRGGYLNCKLAVQMATGIPKVTELPKVKKHQPGDVLSWGPTHYAIALSNNRVVHVPEWGGEVETAHLDDLKNELGPPQTIHRVPAGTYLKSAV